MSTWIIVSWVCVAIITGINIFLFIKLKSASEQMLKMAFPNAKNMGEAMSQMQSMMGGMGGMPNMGNMMGKGFPQAGGKSDAQLKAAMEMLRNRGPKR